MKRDNLFISFEGIDGCGKDTQLHKLVEEIKDDAKDFIGDKYSNIWVTRNPSKITESGKKIAQLIRERDVSKEEATKYFVSDRCEHSRMIEEFLKHSFVLISRYDLSTLSYQMAQGMDFDELYNLHKFGESDGCLIPDITIVFDLDVETALIRTSGRDSAEECFEKKDFQEKVCESLKLAVSKLRKKDGRNIIVVDASKSIEEVTIEMKSKILEVLSEN